ncbi:DUF2059 domain-containing protein [Photobacterium sp. WH77]|uniref:DUF2059 domain-containing protein n=1 Tax=unclassified Photobacterium TaxID=2628852 RepID=UPI001EDC2371|nr:DUF2059 domain-containing protein [Photobacterium sp. 2_MG-2023]MCG2838850.1 DUF2059 domain-containing protein [Photobacterium sp. WH77]MCG2846467.1 DUF2059 domain-containing protein [Photobacterium sp. WH80]MDO6582900.1 DUF2059 domain-containing protein [Photobacterium sp. 2_MG-2023]
MFVWVVLFFPFSTLADDAAHIRSAEKLVDVLNINESIDVTVEGLRSVALSQYAQFIDVDNEDEASLAVSYSYMHKQVLSEFYHSKKVMNLIVTLYKEAFTKEELDEIFDFYMSSTGKKLIQELPRIQQKMQPVMISEVKQLQPVTDDLMIEFKKELQRMRDSNR